MALLLGARDASAHAPPQATGVFSSGADADRRVWVRTNRGVVLKAAHDDVWRLLCSAAYGASLSEVPPVIPVAEGLLVASYDSGILRISPDGCGAQSLDAPLGDRHVVDLAAAPDGSRYWALLAPSPSQSGALLESVDAGASWTSRAELSPFATALRVAPSDAKRLYVSALESAEDGSLNHELLVSSDGGVTFSSHAVPLLDSEVRAFVIGVDPLDAERVFLRTLAGDPEAAERLLLSENGGESFSEVSSAVGPLAFAVDEQAAWLGGKVGLWRSDDRGKSFEAVAGAPTYVGCLATDGTSLLVCGYQDAEFGVFRLGSTAAGFDSELRFGEVTSQVACGQASAIVALCQADFDDWLAEQAPGSETGAAGAPSSPGAGGGSDAEPGSSGARARPGCSIGGPYERSGAGALALLAVLRLCRGRRRR